MSDGPYIRIRLDVEYPGANIHAFGGWPAYRDLMNRLVRALVSMEGGPEETEVVPTSLVGGSLVHELFVPERSIPAVQRFRKGPVAGGWSRREVIGARPLHQWLREHNAEATLRLPGAQNAYRVNVPEAPERVRGDIRQWETLRANVFRVGGRDRVAELRFELDAVTLKCDIAVDDDEAADDLARRLGNRLYGDVIVEGRTSRNAETGELKAFTIIGYRDASARAAGSLRERMREAIGDVEIDLSSIVEGRH